MRERGQVLVIFAGSIVLFVALCAVVVDVSWYWANTLRVQRAADAAALAGAVFLPAQHHRARTEPREGRGQKNGYTDGAKPCVTPAPGRQERSPAQRHVSAPVGTFFMRVFGITQIQAVRRSKAEYVLPVPMGSPQNYYGVGEFVGTPITKRSPTAAVSGGTWTNPTRADANDNNLYAVSATAAGSAQQWRDFNLTTGSDAIEAGARIGLIEVSLRARLTGSGTTTTNCRLLAALSWNGGASWTSNTVATPALTTTETLYSLPTGTATWDGRTWAQGDFTNANFRVRLTWDKPSCSSSRTASVDTLEVAVASEKQLPVNDPAAGTALAPQNFWGAIFTKGGVRQNGDYYAPATIGGSASGVYTPTTGASPTYNASGYDYTVDFTGSANDGQVRLFDPIFCATGPNATSGWYGAGDHWTTQGSSGNTVVAPVAITYRLYHDINNTPYNTGDDTSRRRLPTIRPARRSATSAARSGARAASRTTTTPTSRTARTTRPTTAG